MQTLFCTECGHKMVYSGAKPKFCSSCGAPIGVPSKPEKSSSKRSAPSIKDQIIAKKNSRLVSEDETDAEYVPEINSLKYEISTSGNPTYKFGELLSENAEESEQTVSKPKRQRRSPRRKK